jgi:rsbT antagonist protein RsbS
MACPKGIDMETHVAAMNLVNGCLVTTIQFDLNRQVLKVLQEEVLQKLQETRARGLILDCSALALMDSQDFAGLKRLTAMASLLGAQSVFVGLGPGIVSSLVELDIEIDGVQATLTLEDAFTLCQSSHSQEESLGDDSQVDSDECP